MSMSASYKLSLITDMIEGLGLTFKPETVILDFGCGSGTMVAELRKLGYQAFGCDIEFDSDKSADTLSMKEREIIRLINIEKYVLPFESNTFDIIFSDQVFEHVQNYSEVIAELARVLKPEGCCLHIFPSRYRPIETHLSVPLGSIFKSYPWLYLWSSLGVHNEYQGGASSKDGTTAKEIADFNYQYLRNKVNYLSKASLFSEFSQSFDEVEFCEKEFLKNTRRGKYIYRLSKILPFLPAIYGTFKSRVILTKKPNQKIIS